MMYRYLIMKYDQRQTLNHNTIAVNKSTTIDFVIIIEEIDDL